ncbi:MAG: molecular chaperone DnaJ [Flavobacteriales bacterium]|nr:molecular chaperone DnaJ [Flavobacteriales bacterium]NCP61428.1 molecular chaperone DnaJ [Flavobacteriales bacterium]NCP90830.1 molecular chaperone DnaJ [Flavobacteriales bacterium]NCQ15955.1 molecular chaperone DnaJ [Flavobacteriales bacterium]
MNDTIIKDTLQVAKETINKSITSESNEQINWWLWVAIIEFLVIIFLVLKQRIKPKDSIKQKFKKESLGQEIDFNNIINSSFNSKQLYDELKVKCHPDLFPTDKEKNIIAENIFQEITKNQNNAKRLIELKEEAKQKLNINF